MDGDTCVLSVHDADSLVKLMATDAIQEVASDRRLCRVVALVSQPVFEALREIHVRGLCRAALSVLFDFFIMGACLRLPGGGACVVWPESELGPCMT